MGGAIDRRHKPWPERRPVLGIFYLVLIAVLLLSFGILTLPPPIGWGPKREVWKAEMQKIVEAKALGTLEAKTPLIERRPRIVLDWGFPFLNFSLRNYKALESLLALYTDAQVLPIVNRVRRELFARYRFLDVLPLTIFEKYCKRGYDVSMAFADLRQGTLEVISSCVGRLGPITLPKAFFVSELQGNLRAFASEYLKVAAHFFALSTLWETGGVYTDFSFIFTVKPLRGFYFAPCVLDTELPYARRSHRSFWMAFDAYDPLLGCMLESFSSPTFLACARAELGSHGYLLALAPDCLETSLLHCAKEFNFSNNVAGFVDIPDVSESCNGSGGGGGDGTKISRVGEDKKTIFWYGAETSSPIWTVPNASVSLALHSARNSIALLRSTPEQRDCPTTCGQFKLTADADSAVVSSLAYRCPPHFVLAGFQKAATTTLFSAVVQHPQILRPLSGPDFKEPHAYSRRSQADSRPLDYPFIAPGEHFITADGTTTTSNPVAGALQAIHADAPESKVVFSVRDPLHRFWSDYWFYDVPNKPWGKGGLASVLSCLGPLQECLSQADMATRRWCFQLCPVDPVDMLRQGVYWPEVKSWVATHGRANVLVVPFEEIKEELSSVLRKFYKHLGVCPWEPSSLNVLARRKNSNGRPLQEMGREVYDQLRAFFAPHNVKLAALMATRTDLVSSDELLAPLRWNHRTFDDEKGAWPK